MEWVDLGSYDSTIQPQCVGVLHVAFYGTNKRVSAMGGAGLIASSIVVGISCTNFRFLSLVEWVFLCSDDSTSQPQCVGELHVAFKASIINVYQQRERLVLS